MATIALPSPPLSKHECNDMTLCMLAITQVEQLRLQSHDFN